MFKGKNVAVFDCEIKKRIEECSRGWKSHDEMGISVCVIYDYTSGRYRIFDDKNAAEAVAILNTYDYVVGFNTVGFDWKLVNATWGTPERYQPPTPPGGTQTRVSARKSKDFDVLREIWISLNLNPDIFNPHTHGGYKLDDVAADTLGMRKTSNGALAPLMFQDGRIAELYDYCVEDVRIERSLFEFAARYGYVCRGGRRIQLNIPNELRL